MSENGEAEIAAVPQAEDAAAAELYKEEANEYFKSMYIRHSFRCHVPINNNRINIHSHVYQRVNPQFSE